MAWRWRHWRDWRAWMRERAPAPGATLARACAPLLLAALLPLAGCGNATSLMSTPPATATATVPSPRPPFTPVVGVLFPQQVPAPRNQAMMAALLEGTLVLRDGCLRVIRSGGTDVLILWPAEGRIVSAGGTIRVVAGDGRAIAQVGGPIVLGGGETSSARGLNTPERARLQATPPAACPGPYWVAHFIPPAPPTPTTVPPTPTGSRQRGARAITPHLTPTAPGQATFSEADVRAHIAATGVNFFRISATGPYQIERVDFLTGAEARARSGFDAGLPDDRLLCLATVRGAFTLSGPYIAGQGPYPHTFTGLILVFDGLTGNRLGVQEQP